MQGIRLAQTFLQCIVLQDNRPPLGSGAGRRASGRLHWRHSNLPERLAASESAARRLPAYGPQPRSRLSEVAGTPAGDQLLGRRGTPPCRCRALPPPAPLQLQSRSIPTVASHCLCRIVSASKPHHTQAVLRAACGASADAWSCRGGALLPQEDDKANADFRTPCTWNGQVLRIQTPT